MDIGLQLANLRHNNKTHSDQKRMRRWPVVSTSWWWRKLKLTVKDKDFLEKLRKLMDEKYLSIELKRGPASYFVLRGNYGEKIENEFGMTRQGVRWRFWRLFNDVYVSAYETVYWLERTFGIHLRDKAIEIAKQRFVTRQKIRQETYVSGIDHARKGFLGCLRSTVIVLPSQHTTTGFFSPLMRSATRSPRFVAG